MAARVFGWPQAGFARSLGRISRRGGFCPLLVRRKRRSEPLTGSAPAPSAVKLAPTLARLIRGARASTTSYQTQLGRYGLCHR